MQFQVLFLTQSFVYVTLLNNIIVLKLIKTLYLPIIIISQAKIKLVENFIKLDYEICFLLEEYYWGVVGGTASKDMSK